MQRRIVGLSEDRSSLSLGTLNTTKNEDNFASMKPSLQPFARNQGPANPGKAKPHASVGGEINWLTGTQMTAMAPHERLCYNQRRPKVTESVLSKNKKHAQSGTHVMRDVESSPQDFSPHSHLSAKVLNP